MSGGTTNHSVDEQHATFAAAPTAATKRKEDDAMAAAQATVATTHREQEALVTTVATARKTLDEARVHESATTLT
jgi:hypothetical protein